MRCELRLLAVTMLLVLTTTTRAADVSTLWGEHGEKWSPTSATSLLPDFRYAGYHSGRDPIPDVKAVADVRKFGAKGDGTADDTKAFLAAVKAAGETKGGGAVEISAGRYVITNVIKMPSRVVLRGAGAGKTTLVIPKSLQDLGGENTVEEEKSGYAFSGGFVTIAGKPKTRRIAPLAADAKRGDRKLALESSGKIKPGDRIRVVTNNDPSLGRYLHNDRFDAGKATFDHDNFTSWVARVVAVDKKSINLDRPLRIDLRKQWQPEVWTYQPGVEEVGVENLTFEFAGRAKKPHLKEEGFNAIYFDGGDNCWVRGVEFVDADNAVNVTRARFVTVQDVTFREAKRKSPSGHHALWARQAQDCRFTNFTFETQYVHDLSVEGFSCGNVFEKGKGVAMNFDHHANAPYENLFTDIAVGDISRLWSSGGRGDRLPHTAARSVIWGITYNKGKPPKLPDWPQLIVVGVKGYAKGDKDLHVEEAGGTLKPANLFEAQKSLKPTAATTAARAAE
jgi:hypothetical protein